MVDYHDSWFIYPSNIYAFLFHYTWSRTNLETAIRGVTLELTCHVLRQLLQALEHDSLFNAAIEDATKRSIQRLLSSLRPFVSSEKLFLEMFEDEFFQLEVITKYIFPCYYLLPQGYTIWIWAIPPIWTIMIINLLSRLTITFSNRCKILRMYELLRRNGEAKNNIFCFSVRPFFHLEVIVITNIFCHVIMGYTTHT